MYIFKLLSMTLLIIYSLGLLPSQATAHPGKKDELGGHFRTSDCTYFLHDPSPLVQTASNLEELLLLIQKHNSSVCTQSLTKENIGLEGYTFQTAALTPVNTGVTDELQVGHKFPATLVKCTDGDTATFMVNGKSYKTRFLYIDTPESTNKIEPFGKEASKFTCNFLKNGNITLETDGPSLFDKYNRLLAWVWVGDILHQEEITKAGLVKGFYDYGDYRYEDKIIRAMDEAKSRGNGMYKGQNDFNIPLLPVVVGLLFIAIAYIVFKNVKVRK